MKTTILRRLLPAVGLAAVVFGAILIVSTRAADESQSKSESLQSRLQGEWQLVSQADGKPLEEDFVGEVKFIGAQHWGAYNTDLKTKKVKFFLGGRYTLNGDEYVESVEHGTSEVVDMIGRKLTFKVKVEGDKFTQIGVGNPYSQSFRRVK